MRSYHNFLSPASPFQEMAGNAVVPVVPAASFHFKFCFLDNNDAEMTYLIGENISIYLFVTFDVFEEQNATFWFYFLAF